MSRRQPTYREALSDMRYLEYRMSWARGVEMTVDGFIERLRVNTYVNRWPVSDISLKCFDCGTIIRDRRDGQGLYQFVSVERDVYHPRAQSNYFKKPKESRGEFWASFCLGCQNKRRPMLTASLEWHKTAHAIRQINKEITNAKNCD